MREIRLSPGLSAKIIEQCRHEYPDETCGLLIGKRTGLCTHVMQLYPVANVASSDQKRHFYQMDARGILNAQKYADQNGLEILGVYHSHPDHPAEPSQTDLKLAWEELSYLIIEIRNDGTMPFRCWRLSGDTFLEENVVIE